METIKVDKHNGTAYLKHLDTWILMPSYIIDEFALFNGNIIDETKSYELWSITDNDYAQIIHAMLKHK